MVKPAAHAADDDYIVGAALRGYLNGELCVCIVLFGGNAYHLHTLGQFVRRHGIKISHRDIHAVAERTRGKIAGIGGDAQIVHPRMLGHTVGVHDSACINKRLHFPFPQNGFALSAAYIER